MNVEKYQGIRLSPSGREKVEDALVVEAALDIHINGSPFTVTMCTPGLEEALVRGLLHSEDVFRGDNSEIRFEISQVADHHARVNALIPETQLGKGYLNGRSLLSVASCGICGKKELDLLELSALEVKDRLDPVVIPEMLKTMTSMQHAWSLTGGSHASAAFKASGELLSIAEDIGRHNAVDKVIGELLMRTELSNASALLVSSRVSYEIVAKTFTAGIPVLIAVSAPSSLAVDFAKELGITLIAFTRGNRFTVYSCPERIQLTPNASEVLFS